MEEAIYQAAEQGVATALGLKAHGFDSAALDRGLIAWYSERSFLPFWIEDNVPSARAEEARSAIANSAQDGLRPQDYFLDLINARWDRADLQGLAELDLILTVGVGLLAADATEGRSEPLEVDSKSFSDQRLERPNLATIVKAVVYRQEIGQAIKECFPQHRQYARMKQALAQYRDIAAKGGWHTLSLKKGSTLGATSSTMELAALAQRLQASGDLAPDYTPSGQFDQTLEAAIKQFQSRHGLPQTGEIGSLTIAELNVPVETRINTLLMNLERWRWLDRDLNETKEVLVNIAGFELFALENSELKLRLPVIVGKTYHATPVFSDRIRYIEMNPVWNVPPSIAANEMLPKLRKDSNYLSSQHMRLYQGWGSNATEISPSTIDWQHTSPKQMNGYAVRQDPGPWNALGTLKFVFPNSFNVYLHDTASRGLFAERTRAFSHGCIRVSTPESLAAFLLDSPSDEWSIARVRNTIAGGEQKIVKLPSSVRIHLTYRTAWVEKSGVVQFRPDIYGRDAKMAEVLFRK